MSGPSSLELVLLRAGIPLGIAGLIGNVLVIRIVHKTREMHTTTNYLLANLAVGDVITIIVGPLFRDSHLVGYLTDGFGKFACKFSALFNISVMVSSFTLTVLAVERYHALLKPFSTRLRLKGENVKLAIALIWISSVLFCLPFFFFQEWSESYSTCIGPWSLHVNQASEIYLIISLVLGSYFPVAVFFYCYGSLIKGLYFTNTVCPETNEERSAEKKKLITTFVLATAGFVIGYLPTTVLFSVLALGQDKHIDFKMYYNLSAVFSFLFYCSLCFNPILYAFRSTNFQEGFKRIIFCRRSPPPNEVQLR